jgi:demethylmenaquinone methyltransferase/2-methoxy-6-polyprenyl-1,4-benzoquinol methylase
MTKNALPTGDVKRAQVQEMFDDIAPTYEKTNRFISLGLDRRARRIALRELRQRPGAIVLDLASGTGDFARMLRAHNIVSISVDLSYGMLHASRDGINRVQCDGSVLPLADESVDGIVCGYSLRNFVDLDVLFHELMRVVKPRGKFVAVDVSVPTNRLLRAGNRLWLAHLAPKIGWLISKNKKAYEYLPQSTAYLPPREKIVEMLISAGAEKASVDDLYGGSLILISATKPPKLEE